MLTFQQLILKLNAFWDRQGCALLQPYDMEVGAGTFHTATFLRAIGPEPWNAAYVQPSRRPKDGRYGDNPNRLQHYYQYQVVLKPSPADIQDVYLDSLKNLGINPLEHDIRFVEDDWESPTLGAWGLGWEVWLDGMEITQFTYFQEVGSLACKPVLGEITYGLERLAMYLQAKDSIYDLVWTPGVTYGDVYKQNEVEQSRYNFDASNADMLFRHFGEFVPPGFDWLMRTVDIPMSNFSRGKSAPALQVAGQRVAVNICYEDVFGDEIAARLPEATLLVNLSNVAWFGDSLAPAQHLQIGRMRALETGRMMLTATNTGITAAIAADGAVLAQLPQFAEGRLDVEARGRSGATPYVFFADGPALALSALLLVFFALRRPNR